MKKLFYLLIVIICGVQYSCKEEAKEPVKRLPDDFSVINDENGELLWYLYIDSERCVHSSKECDVFSSGEEYGVYKINFKDTISILPNDYKFYCAKCISTQQYIHIKKIAERNMTNVEWVVEEIEKNVSNKRKLYDELSKDYDLGSFKQFCDDIESDEKRRKLYDAIKDEYDLGSYDSFSRQLMGE